VAACAAAGTATPSAAKTSQDTAGVEASEWSTHIHRRPERKLLNMDRAYEPRRRSSGVDADPGSAAAAAVGDGDGVSAIASRSFLDLAFLLAAAS
jgi:hypothetical protein